MESKGLWVSFMAQLGTFFLRSRAPSSKVWEPLKGHLEREQPQLEDFLTIVANYSQTGMILQVPSYNQQQLDGSIALLDRLTLDLPM